MTLTEYTPPQPVLLIEDDPHESAVLRRWLESTGRYGIRTAADGQLATELLTQQRWSLVVADLNLPSRSGLEILHTLRETDDVTPFLLISGNASTTDACTALRSRANDFLLKPLTFESFTAATEALAGSYTETVRRGAVIQSRLESRRHGQFLSAGRLLVSQLTSPITRLSLSADNLVARIAKGVPPRQGELVAEQAAIDLAVRDATKALDELKALLGMTAAGLQSADLVSQAQAAMFLASPALSSRGVSSALNLPTGPVHALGSPDTTRTAITSILLSLAENAQDLRLRGVAVTVAHRNATPTVRITIYLEDPTQARGMLARLGAYYDMLLTTCGGFTEVATELDGANLTFCFQGTVGAPGILQ